MPWYSLTGEKEKVESPSLPVTVEAPIILDATTRAGIQPLFDFITGLECNSNTAIAAAEGVRLKPYFNALSGYLGAVMAEEPPEKRAAAEKEELSELVKPERLSGLFNIAAERTHNTMISDVVILPSNVIWESPAARLFKDQPQFSKNYSYDGHMFNFGFLQVYEGGSKNGARSSTAFPVFLVDDVMMEKIIPHGPHELLRGLQSVMTFVNHDMLHHFTMPLINPIVAHKFDGAPNAFGFGAETDPLRVWFDRLPDKYSPLYEEWAQMGHEKALLNPANQSQVDEIRDTVTKYFGEVGRIAAAIQQDPDGKPEQLKTEAHRLVNYYGLVMAHALTRVFPLDHPVMAHCLECLEKTDPDPGRAIDDCNRNFFGRPMQPADVIPAVRNTLYFWPEVKSVVESYQRVGLDILPDDNAQAASYRNIKMLELIKISTEDIQPHIPAPLNLNMAQMRKNADEMTLDMILGAAKSYGFRPK